MWGSRQLLCPCTRRKSVRTSRLRSLLSMTVLLVGIAARLHASSSDGVPAANELLREVVDNELKAQAQDHSHWKYQSTSHASGKEITKEVIQSKDGEIEGLLSINGQHLQPAEERSEEQRIQKLVKNPQQERKRQRDQAQDAQKTEHLFRVLPHALIASYGERKAELTELDFKPNPSFRPSSHEEQVFHALEGKIWVNTKENRLAQIDGHLIESVKFGGGLLGHLDKGGRFQVRQSQVAPGHWDITLMHIEMSGKALFFKIIAVRQDESRGSFQRVPDNLTLDQAAAELREDINKAKHR